MYNGRAGGEVERIDIKGEERAKRKTSEGKERRKNR